MGKLLHLLLAVALLAVLVPALNPRGQATIPCVQQVAGVTLCPDLIVDPAKLNVQSVTHESFTSTSCDVVEGMTQPGARTLLRFYQSTPNFGTGDLVVGNPSQHPEWFYYAPCHHHYHFREYADYRLWKPDQFATWKQLKIANPDVLSRDLLAAHPELRPIAGNKGGFCVIDIFPYAPVTHPTGAYRSCSTNQGISVGWADEYVPNLDGQFIDVTGVPSGAYVLESEVNAERLYVESNYVNNDWFAPSFIP